MIPFVIIFTLLIGLLWRMGGSDSFGKVFRGIGVPIAMGGLAFISMTSFFPLLYATHIIFIVGVTIGIGYVVLTISYGMNSPLGKLFEFIKNPTLRDVVIRGICGLCWSAVYLPLIAYKGNYWLLLAGIIPTVLIPVVRVSKLDSIGPWVEEFMMGIVYALGMALVVLL